MTIESEKFESVLENFEIATDWIQSIGVRIGRGRLTTYKKFLIDLIDKYKDGTVDEVNDLFLPAMKNFHEIKDICNIYEGLKSIEKNQLIGIKSKLQKAVFGPDSVTEETEKNSSARNHLFESLVSARLHNPANDVIVNLLSKSDTLVTFSNKKYFIECKRVQSIGNIEKNLKKATDQLTAIFKRKIGSNNRGLIALDVSRVINPNFYHLAKKDDNSLEESVDGLLTEFIDDFGGKWQKDLAKRNRKIVGFLFRLSLMGISENRSLMVYCHTWALVPRESNSSIEKLFLEEFVKAFKNKQRIRIH